MKDRRPRKLKKRLKRRFEKVQALRTVQCALVSVGSAFQIAAVSARPIPSFLPDELKRGPMTAAEKALECASIAIDTAESISKIWNTGPKNWREA